MRRTKRLMTRMAPPSCPAGMTDRLSIAVSGQLAAQRHAYWKGGRRESFLVRGENALSTLLFAATAGLVFATLIFGLLIGVLVPVPMSNTNDVPTILYTPPEMTSAPIGLDVDSGTNDAILVEAIIDPQGRVEDYRVLNSAGGSGLSAEMKNALIFAQFRPATSFGLPTSGRVVISFSSINVGG